MVKRVVAQFVYSLNDGGAETLIKNYCRLIDRTKFDVVIVVMYDIGGSAVKTAIQNMGIPIVYIYPHRNIVYRGINFLVGKIIVKNKIRRIIKQYHITTIHAHTAVLRYLYYTKSELKNIRLLYTCHSTPDRYFSGRLREEDSAARYLIDHNGLQMIALHDEMSREINSWFGINNTIVVRNGLILDDYRHEAFDKEKTREMLGIKRDAFVIGHVGRFIEEKNHRLIIQIFSEIKAKQSSAFLFLIGDGELENDVINYLDNAGLQSDYLILSHRNDVPMLLSAMDLFLFPSKVEGLGIALVEAQIMELPCIISDRIPQEAIISESVSILGLEDSLSKWTKEAEELYKTTNRCHEDRLQLYDLESQVRILENYY